VGSGLRPRRVVSPAKAGSVLLLLPTRGLRPGLTSCRRCAATSSTRPRQFQAPATVPGARDSSGIRDRCDTKIPPAIGTVSSLKGLDLLNSAYPGFRAKSRRSILGYHVAVPQAGLGSARVRQFRRTRILSQRQRCIPISPRACRPAAQTLSRLDIVRSKPGRFRAPCCASSQLAIADSSWLKPHYSELTTHS